jgi:hypothetical protein
VKSDVAPMVARAASDRMKPHGRDCPHACSQCLAAPVHRVTLVDGRVLVDGRPERAGDPETPMQQHYSRRGGNKHGRRRQT